MNLNNLDLLMVFGMPRSGTTWLAKIIDSHPGVLYRHESDSENKAIIFDLIDNLEDEKNFISKLVKLRTARTCGKAPFFKKNYFNTVGFNVFKVSAFLAKFSKKNKFNLKVYEPISNVSQVDVLLWKSIESIMYIDSTMACLKKSKMIYIIRHPCGQIASTVRGEHGNKFSGGSGSSEDYNAFDQLLKQDYAQENNITIDYLKLLNPIQRLAMRWVLNNEYALNSLEKYSSRSMIVRYEDICHQPIQKSKDIYRFINLSWTCQNEVFLGNSVSTNNRSYYSVFKNPIASMNNWKNYFTDEDIKSIKNIIIKSKAFEYYKNDF